MIGDQAMLDKMIQEVFYNTNRDQNKYQPPTLEDHIKSITDEINSEVIRHREKYNYLRERLVKAKEKQAEVIANEKKKKEYEDFINLRRSVAHKIIKLSYDKDNTDYLKQLANRLEKTEKKG